MGLFDLSLGPILLGVIVNIWLYGILVAQVGMYFTTFPGDHKWIKVLVAGLFLTDTLNSIFDVVIAWRYTITLFGDLAGLGFSHWSLNIEPLMTVMISSTAQAFYAWRIFKLTGQRWLGWMIGVLAFIEFAAGLGSTIGGFVVGEFARFQELKVPVTIWLVASAIADILITGILTGYLLTHRTGNPKTDDIITRLVRLTMQTGLMVTIWAIINLILYLTMVQGNNVYLFFQMPLCKLYTNSLLSTLNARVGMRDTPSNTENMGTSVWWGRSGGRYTQRNTAVVFRVEPTGSAGTTRETNSRRDDGFEELGMNDVKWTSRDVESGTHSQTKVQLPGAFSTIPVSPDASIRSKVQVGAN